MSITTGKILLHEVLENGSNILALKTIVALPRVHSLFNSPGTVSKNCSSKCHCANRCCAKFDCANPDCTHLSLDSNMTSHVVAAIPVPVSHNERK